ncbi:GNAT family N-acetyltransferase [Mucilaginibacter sp. SJ]|uniref:GNAT family N-acetyltransferase n=1 Tax=Mucilaginibacter sp. SJ TaxID=3029053 RepID=UPI0023AA004B|nr:GNAT family N-acetyltransferase [Mucilaginibacter sp. SJ]WEA01710.1 GNAT family N-acetyltransferase [Mucilaginibacter sp. SJ]
MLTPIYLEHDAHIIQSFSPDDLSRWSVMADDVFELLSDKQMLKYLPSKRLRSVRDADNLLKNALLNLYCGRNYIHFIRKKSDNQIIGIIDVVSPDLAKEHYDLQQYPYFIEFYLKSEYSQKRLMSSLLPHFLESLRSQSVLKVAAVIHRQNTAARKLLYRAGFNYRNLFDATQDIYEFSAVECNVA